MATHTGEHPTALTYLGHACIRINIGDTTILMDPWLVGPSNGGGWWHLPAVTETPESLSSIDYIMRSESTR
ncbi:MAG: MBL fold metallo-hydrolase, partial [Vicinamibacterales bacterium]